MKELINKCSLSGDKYIPELHLKHPGFTYSACGPFTKHRKRIQKVKDTSNLKHLYRNKLNKTQFAHDTTYSVSKVLAKRTISDKILKDGTYEIAIICKYDGYQRSLASIINRFLIKKTGLEVSVNEQLAEEPHKPVIKRNVYAKFKENIWEAI